MEIEAEDANMRSDSHMEKRVWFAGWEHDAESATKTTTWDGQSSTKTTTLLRPSGSNIITIDINPHTSAYTVSLSSLCSTEPFSA
jgi:hypothetical protein